MDLNLAKCVIHGMPLESHSTQVKHIQSICPHAKYEINMEQYAFLINKVFYSL